MKRIFILGHLGNMAQRYRAILNYLGHRTEGADINEGLMRAPEHYDGFIVATPTYMHLDHLQHLIKYEKPVLCEKPFINTRTQMPYLKRFLKFAEEEAMQLSMVSQYDYLVDPLSEGFTEYNYFRSGNDGLEWDCINIIKHAKGKIHLATTNPVWTCQINGHYLDQSDMDEAYVQTINDWLEKPYVPQYDLILKAHQKVLDYLDGKLD